MLKHTRGTRQEKNPHLLEMVVLYVIPVFYTVATHGPTSVFRQRSDDDGIFWDSGLHPQIVTIIDPHYLICSDGRPRPGLRISGPTLRDSRPTLDDTDPLYLEQSQHSCNLGSLGLASKWSVFLSNLLNQGSNETRP